VIELKLCANKEFRCCLLTCCFASPTW